MIKKFICGFCRNKKGKEYVGTRKGLRKHLREEHRIMNEITNMETEKGIFKQNWWKTEEWNE